MLHLTKTTVLSSLYCFPFSGGHCISFRVIYQFHKSSAIHTGSAACFVIPHFMQHAFTSILCFAATRANYLTAFSFIPCHIVQPSFPPFLPAALYNPCHALPYAHMCKVLMPVPSLSQFDFLACSLIFCPFPVLFFYPMRPSSLSASSSIESKIPRYTLSA